MKIRWLLLLGAVILAAGAGVAWWLHKPAAPTYLTARAAKGDVVRSIITSGTVNPVVTVQVGSYVSGPILSTPRARRLPCSARATRPESLTCCNCSTPNGPISKRAWGT